MSTNTKRLIAFAGPSGSGKDTAANVFANQLVSPGASYINLKFASRLKAAAAELTSYPVSYFETSDRHTFRQELGCSLLEFILDLSEKYLYPRDPLFFTKVMLRELYYSSAPLVFITDVRIRSEVDFVLKTAPLLGFTPSLIYMSREDAPKHSGSGKMFEIDTYDYALKSDFDNVWTLDNNGDLNDLETNCTTLISKITVI